MIVKKKLPHGKIPISDIKDIVVRDKIMKINENIAVLSGQILELQNAVLELQKKTR